jgi:hypothetical protein
VSRKRQKLTKNHQMIGSPPPTGDIRAHHPRGGRYRGEPVRASREGCPRMADLAYALVFIGVFLVLAFTLRGLERL